MKSPFEIGGVNEDAAFAEMQAAAFSLEHFAVRQAETPRTHSTEEILAATFGRDILGKVRTLLPTDAELLVLFPEKKSLYNAVHTVTLREGEPYKYSVHGDDVDVQSLGPKPKTLTGVREISEDPEARRVFLHMGKRVESMGAISLSRIVERPTKLHRGNVLRASKLHYMYGYK